MTGTSSFDTTWDAFEAKLEVTIDVVARLFV